MAVKLAMRVYDSIAMLRGNPHFELFLREGLAEHVKHHAERCIASDGTVQSRAAGAVQALQDLETMIHDAQKILEKMKSNTPKGT